MPDIFRFFRLHNLSWKFISTPIRKLMVKYGRPIYQDNHWERQFTYRDSFPFPVNDNLKIICRKNSYISRKLFDGDFEREEIWFMQHFLRPDDVVIDIGANIGYHTLIAANQLKTGKGKVYAFEPAPVTYGWLVENIGLNDFKNVVTQAKAFAGQPGNFVLFQYQDGKDAFNSFSNILSNTAYVEVQVETTTLDLFMENEGLQNSPVTLIKIDVEGWELPVLEGGKKYLSRPDAPVLMIEFNDNNARKAGFNCQKLYDFGKELGYSWFEIQGTGFLPSSKKSFYKYQNLYAAKNPELVLQRLATAASKHMPAS